MYGAVILALLALICAGCAKPPPRNSVSQAAFFRSSEYQTWTCPQLVDEANLLLDALAVATEQERSAETNSRVAHIQRSSEAVHNEMARKKCKA
jgi:hypothetical protein